MKSIERMAELRVPTAKIKRSDHRIGTDIVLDIICADENGDQIRPKVDTVGRPASKHHRERMATYAAIEELDVSHGETALDVGCAKHHISVTVNVVHVSVVTLRRRAA